MKIMSSKINGRVLRYIFTGTPRSGTGYISQLMTSGGVNIGHEMFFGMPDYGFYPEGAVGDSSWLAVPYLNLYPKAKKVHIVRNPLKTISSMYHMKHISDASIGRNPYSFYKVRYLPEIMQHKGLDRYLFFWIVWNNVAEKECEKTFQLEKIASSPSQLFRYLGIDTKGKKLYKKVYNQCEGVKQLDISDLKKCNKSLVKTLKEQAERYGYTI